MRLTLRTLLAWLDDTLPSAEVRQIGHQVNESPVARELIERIHRVTRQRRLTIPPASGPDATDPNLVAEYLDNLLTAEKVGEFEKLCLRSDVHLAEVASAHQILSLLGQKAKVPAEARLRMYRLIKGREAARPSPSRLESAAIREPAAALPPWTPPEPPKPSWAERYGPPVGVAALIGLLAWSTYLSLAPSPPPVAQAPPALAAGPGPVGPQAGAPAGGPAEARPPVPTGGAAGFGTPPPGTGPAGRPEAPEPEPEPEPGAGAMEAGPTAKEPTEPEPETAPPTEPETVAAAAPPGNVVGAVGDDVGVLLRRPDDSAAWVRARDQDPLGADELIVGLDPYRNPIELGAGRIVLVQGAVIRPRVAEPGEAARFELISGRVILRAPASPGPYTVLVGDASVSITTANAPVGIERVNRLAPGEPKPAAPSLLVYASSGSAEVKSGGVSESLSASQSVRFTPPKTFADKAATPAPGWVTESRPPGVEEEAGRQFGRFFGDGTPPLTGLVEASVDPTPEMRRYAIEALGSIGQMALVVAAFNNPGGERGSLVRRAAIDAMREILARGGEPARDLHDELVLSGGSEGWAKLVEKLLAGYTAAEARDEATQSNLVKLLQHKDVGIRELALLNLMAISDRADSLGYDPDAPEEGDGLKRWQELLQRGELRPKPARP